MTPSKTNTICFCAVIASAIAPLILWTGIGRDLEGNKKSLQKQQQEVSDLEAENAKLRRAFPQKQLASLTGEQLSELLRLRSEIGLLRRQTNSFRNTQSNNTGSSVNLSPPDPETVAQELSEDTIRSMSNVLSQLQPAIEQFYKERAKPPQSFRDLQNYFPSREGHRMTGLYTFEFVREEGPLPGDTLLLREISPRERQGKTVRIYGFSDGRAVEMTFPDQGGEEGANQIAWEREQLHLPPPSFSRSP